MLLYTCRTYSYMILYIELLQASHQIFKVEQSNPQEMYVNNIEKNITHIISSATLPLNPKYIV